MKSNKDSKCDWIIMVLFSSFFFFSFWLLLSDISENAKRIENPSKELIDKVERKYLNGNLVDDFKIDDSIFYKLRAGQDDCDIYWKNSQNIKFSEREVYFNDEVIIKSMIYQNTIEIYLETFLKESKENVSLIENKKKSIES